MNTLIYFLYINNIVLVLNKSNNTVNMMVTYMGKYFELLVGTL